MKKVYSLLCLALVFCFLIGCEPVTVVSLRPVDVEVIPAHEQITTRYTYKYDFWHGEFRMMPEVQTDWCEAEYRVRYEEITSDGGVDYYWETVGKDDYEAAVRQIELEEAAKAS